LLFLIEPWILILDVEWVALLLLSNEECVVQEPVQVDVKPGILTEMKVGTRYRYRAPVPPWGWLIEYPWVSQVEYGFLLHVYVEVHILGLERCARDVHLSEFGATM
jgi:hypothetical protein